MEVHHHSHSPRRKWTHYFWEFLMLFLAVFCGFLAEYKLEHVIEHNREKEYISSMLEDLNKDTANLSLVMNDFFENENCLDSIMLGFDKGRKEFNREWTKKFIYFALSGYADFIYTDRTLQQLKNSGGLRLIRNKKAAAGIIGYDALIQDLNGELKLLAEYQSKYDETVEKLWSFQRMYADLGIIKWDGEKDILLKKNYWISNDPADFEYLYNKALAFRNGFHRIRRLMQIIRNEVVSLITVLKTEYHLK